jgi:hypothetical protein
MGLTFRNVSPMVLVTCVLSVVAASQVLSAPKVIRVGVAPMENTSTRPINQRLQRDRLAREFQPHKKHQKPGAVVIEAVRLDSSTRADIGREARDRGCDYILYTNLVELRTAGDPQAPKRSGSVSIGSDPLAQYPGPPYMNAPVFRAVVDYRVERVDDANVLFALSASGLEHTDEDGTVSRLLGQIANRVKSELESKQSPQHIQ